MEPRHLLWLAGLIVLCAFGVVIGLAARRLWLRLTERAAALDEDRLLRRLIDLSFDPTSAFLARTRWGDRRRLARILARALDLVSAETAKAMLDVAAEAGVDRGIARLARSKNIDDRLAAVRLMRLFARMRPLLETLASTDPSINVRATALRSLARVTQPPKPAVWSQWLRLGSGEPHVAVRHVLEDKRLMTRAALEHAIQCPQAHPALRGWAVGALAQREPERVGPIVKALLSDPNTPTEVAATAFCHIADPLAVTQLHVYLAEAEDWRLREALCIAARSTYAVTLMTHMTRLASDPDWRVRTAAIAAMKRLGGFDSVPIPPAMRAAQMAAFTTAQADYAIGRVAA